MQERKQDLILKQVELENKYTLMGQTAYISQTKNKARGDTDYAKIIYRNYVQPLAACIETFLENPKNQRLVGDYLEGLDLIAVAHIVLHTVIDECSHDDRVTTQKVSAAIAKYLHTELLIKAFKNQNPLYYQELDKSFKKGQVNSAMHKARVAMFKANKLGIKYTQWTKTENITIGYALLRILAHNFDICEFVKITQQNKSRLYVMYTKEFSAWINTQVNSLSMYQACKPPCVIPPNKWTGFDVGGFHTPEQALTTKFVTSPPRHWKEYRRHFKKMPDVVQAVNAMQNTAWRINKDILDIIKQKWEEGASCLPSKHPLEIPDSPISSQLERDNMTEQEKALFKEWKNEAREVYAKEKKRFGKALAIARTINLAEDFKDFEHLYFVHNVDFRGRIYATSYGVSPQGADYSRAMLEFAEGVEVTPRALFWIKVHTANCYGVDKVSYADRVRWVDDHMDLIRETAKNPSSDIWHDADKPFQFLRACMEIYACEVVGSSHRSHLPVGVDGSCNGLQHFSALLLDDVGGKATNLVPSDKPQDIYQEVANKVITKLQLMTDNPIAKQVLDFGVTRKMAKRPVMTLPYGSTKITCFKAICEHLQDKGYKYDVTEAARIVSPILWSSIEETVISAMEAMNWLKKAAGEICTANKRIEWTTPSDFLVIQDRLKGLSKSITIRIYNKEYYSTATEDIKVMDKIANKNGISPNFVHSMDSSHLVFTIKECLDNNINTFACVHDDYGTYAKDIDTLNTIIRKQFINIYSNYNILYNIKEYYKDKHNIILPDLPNKGTLNIQDIKDSLYFFC